MAGVTLKQNFFLFGTLVALTYANPQSYKSDDGGLTCETHYPTWEDAPASRDEFDHNNDQRVCGVRRVTVDQWEAERLWEGRRPVIVTNATDGWGALKHWTKEEMLRRYPDVKVNMGEAKLIAKTGPDDAGDILSLTTIKDFVEKYMHDAEFNKYVFDRSLNIPKEMLDDCRPLPMPTRAYRNFWKGHLAITIGSDQQGLTWHRHNAAWNVVIAGSKRWFLYDGDRIAETDGLFRMARDPENKVSLTSPNWIRTLYPVKERLDELRNHGADCVQRAGELMFVPKGWGHLVMNIGDTVAIVSERENERDF